MQIHDAGSSRGSFINQVGTIGPGRWWPYNGGAPRNTIGKALAIIRKNCVNSNGCNSYFKHLPGGRSLKEMVEDDGIWIHWDPRADAGFYAATSTEFPVADITVSNFALNKGVWVTAATLVHELAHANGAPSGTSMAAENALPPCGLKGLVDPGAIGWREAADDDTDSRVA